MLQYNWFRGSLSEFLENFQKIWYSYDIKTIDNSTPAEKNIFHNSIPQHKYICYNGELAIDHIYKLETLSTEFDDLKRTYKIDDAVKFPHLHKHVHQADKMLNETLAAQIYELYKRDFELLGYDKDSWTEF